MSTDENEEEGAELSTLRRAKAELNALSLQLSLGKAEALDFIEEQKKTFAEIVHDAEGRISLADVIDSERRASLRQKLDELRLQLALGRMEGRDEYLQQKEKITRAIEDVESDLGSLKESASGAAREVLGGFQDGSESFRTKLDALGLNLGLGLAVAEDEAKLQKEKVKGQLEEAQLKIQPAIEEATERAKEAGAEAREALDGVRESLRKLLG